MLAMEAPVPPGHRKRRKGSEFRDRCSPDNSIKTQRVTSTTPDSTKTQRLPPTTPRVIDVNRCVLVQSGKRVTPATPRFYQDAAGDVDDPGSHRRQQLRLAIIVQRASTTEPGPFPAFPLGVVDVTRCVLAELSGEHRPRNSDPIPRFQWPGGADNFNAEVNDCFPAMQNAEWKCSRQHLPHEP